MALKGSTNAEKIVNYLVDHGLTETAAYGLAGNIQAESGLNPWNLQNSYEQKLGYNDATYTAAVDNGSYGNFANDKAGYGLCQWTSSGRKAGLLQVARSTARSIGDMEMQLEWLMMELSNGYKTVLSGINAAATIREASDIVLTQFERPANQGESVKKLRASYGETIKAQLAGKIQAAAQPSASAPSGADSALVSVVNWTEKNYGKRPGKITGVTIHHMAGDMTIESCMNYHKTCGKSVSANYYIGSDGRIGQAVSESKGAWTSSNKANDMAKVTIEVANCTTDSSWRISDAAYNSLVALVADICRRNGIAAVDYTGNKSGVITEHRMFASTLCPGPTIHGYLTSGKLVDAVNKALGSEGGTQATSSTATVTPGNSYKVRVKIKDLNIRAGAGTNFAKVGKCPVGTYTIVEEASGTGASRWGKLKSGQGWISLDYAERI